MHLNTKSIFNVIESLFTLSDETSIKLLHPYHMLQNTDNNNKKTQQAARGP